MAIALRDLNNLNADDVAAQLDEISQAVQEFLPSLDVRSGVFHDLVLLVHATLATQQQTAINDYLRSRSLKDIEADPSLADDDAVDAILSNFRVTRKQGSKASGEVVIVRDTNTTTTIGSGAVFEANGLRFITEQSYTAKAEESQISSDSDRLISLLDDGTYSFTVPVVAENEGVEYHIRKDTTIVPEVLPTGYIKSFAVEDFSGGADVETNEELLNRLQEGIAAKAVSNRVNMNAFLRDTDEFKDIVASSIIGFGDKEMLRDRRSIVPISVGGRVDWYIRASKLLKRYSLTKTASLIAIDSDGYGTWQFSLNRDDAPGFYEVFSIVPAASPDSIGSFELVDDVRDIDLSGDGFIPDVADAVEGAYSRFQTAVIQFKDTSTVLTDSKAVGDTASYNVEIRGTELVKELQELVSSRDYRSHGADLLIKGAVPVFVNLTFTIHKKADDDPPDTDSIKSALADEINSVGFIGRLYSSQLHDVIHDFLPSGQSVGAIDMFGRLRRPNGTVTYLRSTEALIVPDEPENMVTEKTVQFYVDVEDVAITVESSIPSPS